MSRLALYSLFLTLVTAAQFKEHHTHGGGNVHAVRHSHNQAARFIVDVDGRYVRVEEKGNHQQKPATTNLAAAPKIPAKTNLAAAPKMPAKTNLAAAPKMPAKTNLVATKKMPAKTNLAATTKMHAKTNFPHASKRYAKMNLIRSFTKKRDRHQYRFKGQEQQTAKSTMKDAKAKTKTSQQKKETKKSTNAAQLMKEQQTAKSSMTDAKAKTTQVTKKYSVHGVAEDLPFVKAGKAGKTGSSLVSREASVMRKEHVIFQEKDPTSNSGVLNSGSTVLILDCTKGMEPSPTTGCPTVQLASACESFYYQDKGVFKACRWTQDNLCMWVGDTCNHDQMMRSAAQLNAGFADNSDE